MTTTQTIHNDFFHEVEELGLTAEEQAEIEAAVEAFEMEADRPPSLEESFTEENVEAFVMGEKTLAQVLGIDSEEAYSIAELGYDLMDHNLNDARTLVEGLVVTNPYDAYFHSLLAAIYLRQDQVDAALEEFSLAVELNQQDIDSLVNRGEILLNRGELELALEDLGRAIQLDSEGKSPMANRARLLVAVTTEILRQAVLEDRGEGGPRDGPV